MTADTPTSVATINHLLLGAPYTSPLVIPGDWLVDELEGAVEVGGFTDGLFRWPTRKRSGRPSPILCGDLLRAVRTECAESVQFWWGFSPSLVGRWRRALGVTRRNNPGDQAVARARAALARSLDRKAPPKAPAAWSSEEVEFIRRHGSKRSLAWCAYMLGRSYQSVASKAEELPAQRARPQQCDLEQVRGRSVAPALPAARLAMVRAADRQDPRSGIPPGQEAGPATAAAETPVRPVAALSRRGERGPVLNRGSSAAPRRASC